MATTITAGNATNGGAAITSDNAAILELKTGTGSGAVALTLGASGQFGVGGANYGTAGQVLTSGGASAAPSWAAGGGGGFPAGTIMLFQQTTAPTGWTKQTTHNNKALRVVSGSASSGGTVAFTTAFASQGVSGTVGNTTLSTSQIPSHTHVIPAYDEITFTQSVVSPTSGPATGFNTGAAGGGGSHNHTFTGTAIDLAVQYVDVIFASKD